MSDEQFSDVENLREQVRVLREMVSEYQQLVRDYQELFRYMSTPHAVTVMDVK